jgi:chromosome segregation ATPase
MTHHLLEIELANGSVIPLGIEAESLYAAKQLVQKRLEQLCMRTDYILGNPCPNCHSKQVEIEELKGRIRGYQETNSALTDDYKRISVVAEQRDEALQRLAQSRFNDVTAVAEENNRLKAENQKALEELAALRGARAGNELWIALDQVRTLETQLEQKRVRLGMVEQERDQLVMDKARLSTLAQDNANKAEENLRMYAELKTELGALMKRR